jgi:putative serine protease PepD
MTLILIMALLGGTLVLSVRSTGQLRDDLRRQQDVVEALERDLASALGEVRSQRQALAALDDRLSGALDQPTVEAVVRRVQRSVFTIDAGTRLGTGFVVRSSGRRSLLLTNYHVVQPAWERGSRQVETRRDGRALPGIVVRVNPRRDLALVRVGEALPVLPLRAETPRVGGFILVFGAPEGYEGSVTSGIVSAIRERWIQFSAPVSPGNSGGPVVDAEGHAIGVTAAKVVSAAAEGISFAIPIRVACRTVLEC